MGARGSDLPVRVITTATAHGRNGCQKRFREARWFILRSQTNTFNAVHFGLNTDLILPGADYNGDGRDEVTVVRTDLEQTGRSIYFAGDSNSARSSRLTLGSSADINVIGDYLGDRRADFAVMRIIESGTPLVERRRYILENGGSNQ